MNLNTFGGPIRAGRYDVIVVNGACTLERGVRFSTLVVRGVLDCPECVGGAVLFESGTLACGGGMEVGDIHGHGRCDVAGGLRCHAMRFTGEMRVRETLECQAGARIVGLARASDVRAGGDLRLVGRLEVVSLTARDIVVKPIHSAMFERFGMREHIGRSAIARAEARGVRLWNCECGRICGGTIRLSAHSQAKEVIYEDDLGYDRSSEVMLMRRVRDEGPELEAQRKVA
ncbi:hypothetical protein PT282_03525 [Bifidobacterium sp. ESL0763]|uniref:hypothetical protein n=1 Tax=Bifidobacterium sp. ESL0763 TaxID=2983227 RepID=UPI0023F8557A|nr:hypothetical protein [Bifidobacterium sp. ESL0763]MDF7663739.1 hypothetical protein [Bifidobacterium sp. ESL0763]